MGAGHHCQTPERISIGPGRNRLFAAGRPDDVTRDWICPENSFPAFQRYLGRRLSPCTCGLRITNQLPRRAMQPAADLVQQR